MNRSFTLFFLLSLGAQAFVPPVNNRNVPRSFCLSETTVAEPSLEDNLTLLKRAAETKQEDSDAVFEALSALEKQMRQVAREDPNIAESVLENLNGDWRLIFTTGTKDTQKRTGGRINYFPLKAVQSFRTEGMKIENGIYFGDFPALKFSGEFEFNLKSRKLEFDFNRVTLFGFFDIQLGQNDAAELGAKSGLGSKNNVTNKRKPFFNWISADESIATARGGGGGLALWKRVE
ncbi:hypothetical protein FisN_13Hh233 [Fistulifera solaris]|jgi:hypothetical protein|uniref:Plastid lipid-associated protein/fibrillin conserved domain-containing protein n=1 Tax=Fistulifera solaris TaxID=1519565 RepID=A0A1Z5KNL2_FISSO|nr:hypothetical protein FisN_13Hh233 [Fistulifera solaris]|eukprot:GAX27672.1 hypothetical protein FisN_13Hh233 [Fistulifera solaris]